MDYITLRTRVEDELLRTDLSTNIATWINEARNEIADGTLPAVSPNSHRFSWTYNTTSVSTSASLNNWPSDFIEEISLIDISEEKPLVKIDERYFDQLLYSETDNVYDLEKSGAPFAYIHRGSQYQVYPIQAEELYLRYYAYPAELTSNSDEEEIDKRVPQLIIATACLKGARYMHDRDLMEIFREQVVEYYDKAVRLDQRRKWSNKHLRMKTHRDFDMSHWQGIYQIGSGSD